MRKVFLEFHLLEWSIIPYHYKSVYESYRCFVFLFITLKISVKE